MKNQILILLTVVSLAVGCNKEKAAIETIIQLEQEREISPLEMERQAFWEAEFQKPEWQSKARSSDRFVGIEYIDEPPSGSHTAWGRKNGNYTEVLDSEDHDEPLRIFLNDFSLDNFSVYPVCDFGTGKPAKNYNKLLHKGSYYGSGEKDYSIEIVYAYYSGFGEWIVDVDVVSNLNGTSKVFFRSLDQPYTSSYECGIWIESIVHP